MIFGFLSGISRARLVRRLGLVFLSLNEWIWKRLPTSLRRSKGARRYGQFIHKLVLMRGLREPNGGTYLLRNRPELELIHDLVQGRPRGSGFRIAVLGCSIGMEVYSVRWQLRNLEPLLDIQLVGLDIDQASIDLARSGAYPLPDHAWMVARLTDAERSEIIETTAHSAQIRPHLRHGIQWLVGDACSPNLHALLRKQDLVLANRFLCHMEPEQASACLRNIAGLVAPGGYLFVSGVDLQVRQSVLRDSGLIPLTERLAAIHDGDPSLRECWPLQTSGLEPMDTGRADWIARYAMAYHLPDKRKELREREGGDGSTVSDGSGVGPLPFTTQVSSALPMPRSTRQQERHSYP
ncbi:MAG: methyltransferase domain-containing protein [Burkholderiales bacterium]|nr:methyltransferase domain-containing protein [Burkholderiales bacterium]